MLRLQSLSWRCNASKKNLVVVLVCNTAKEQMSCPRLMTGRLGNKYTWMWQLMLWEIFRSLPCVVTSSNVVSKKRFLPFPLSVCVSTIASGRSESPPFSTRPVRITSCKLIKIRLVFLFLKKNRKIDLDLQFKEDKELYRKTSCAGLSCGRNILPCPEKEIFLLTTRKISSIQWIPTSLSCT